MLALRVMERQIADNFVPDFPRVNVDVPCMGFKHHISQYILSVWQDDWDSVVASKLLTAKPVLGDWQSFYRWCRRDEIVLRRARVGQTHTFKSFLYLDERFPPSV